MYDHGILLESGTNEMELLAVNIAGQIFGINVAKVKSIQQYDEKQVTPIPNTEKAIIGMLQHRGTTIPLIDLALIMEKEVRELQERDIIVITEFNNSINSFKVNGVRRIYRLSWSQFTPINKMFGDDMSVIGSVNIEGEEIMIIDLEYILSTLFPDLIIEDLDEIALEKKDTLTRSDLQLVFAEDSNIIRTTMIKILHQAGYIHVTAFENGKDALEYITQKADIIANSGNKYALITDIEMPEMDGLTLCNNVKKGLKLAQLPVVVFSSLINDQMIAKCKSVGAENYVTKPESNTLVNILDTYLAR